MATRQTQVSWRSVILVASSVSFAIAAVLDLMEVVGIWRIVAVVLSALGFLALGLSAVAAWISTAVRRRQVRESVAATALGGLSARGTPERRTLANPAAGAERSADERWGQVTSEVVVRLAGSQDLVDISERGKLAIGDFFYEPAELGEYLRSQRDSVWCMERLKDGERTFVGYAILLALKPITVERIKSGEIAFGRHILASDIEDSIDRTDAIYLSMIEGTDEVAQLDIGLAVLRRVMRSHDKRRPQLILARKGTPAGGRGMRRLGFREFGLAPYIQATFTDSPEFGLEVERRARLRATLAARKESQVRLQRGSAPRSAVATTIDPT